jgi:uncharacterized protein YjbJ (UPF0337 family)
VRTAPENPGETFETKGECAMNWDRVEGKWKQRRGKAVHHWGKIMNDELAAIAGKYEELVGRLQERYGIAREEARRQVARYKDTVEKLKKSNARLMDLQKAMIKKEKSDRIRKESSGKKQSKPGKSSRKRIRSRADRGLKKR